MKAFISCLVIMSLTAIAQPNLGSERAMPLAAKAKAKASHGGQVSPRVTAKRKTPAVVAPITRGSDRALPTHDSQSQPQFQRSLQRATVDADVMRGYKALGLNQFSQSREAYSQVLAGNPTQRDALLGIAYAHQALGDTAQALATLKRLIELYPRDSDALSALYLIGGGDVATEETRFKQLLERSEHPAAAHYALGVLYFDQNRFGEAERAFSRAAALSPRQPDYAYNWALSLDHLGRARDAARQYVEALNLATQTSAIFNRDMTRLRLHILTTEP